MVGYLSEWQEEDSCGEARKVKRGFQRMDFDIGLQRR